ncbi:MAG: hypothetical protein ABI824_15100 [Acidobacteriota bacterium]
MVRPRRDPLYEKSANGSGDEKELLNTKGGTVTPTHWSRDGRFLLYYQNTGQSTDLWTLSLEGERKAVLLLGTKFNEGYGSFSPGGRWLAYVSEESGRAEIYIRPFDASGPKVGEGKWQVTKDGSASATPKWTSDGKEIVFAASGNGPIMGVTVNGTGPAFQMGTPKQILQRAGNGWGMTGDGKRFVMAVPPCQVQGPAQAPITVVLNWSADLKH